MLALRRADGVSHNGPVALRRRENSKRAVGASNDRMKKTADELKNMSDWHPNFRFTLSCREQ